MARRARRARATSRRLAALHNVPGSQFAVMPTFNVRVGIPVRQYARLFAGYTFQYLSQVARLSDALNPAATSLALTDFSNMWYPLHTFMESLFLFATFSDKLLVNPNVWKSLPNICI